MERIYLTIPEPEFVKLDRLYPNNGKSSVVGERATEIVKVYFTSQDNNSTFEKPTDGDLKITSKDRVLKIEIKGTAEKDICWMKLKVSGEPSYKSLIQGMPLYRVCGVYERSPVIYVLYYSQDFDMIPEPRWSIRPKITSIS